MLREGIQPARLTTIIVEQAVNDAKLAGRSVEGGGMTQMTQNRRLIVYLLGRLLKKSAKVAAKLIRGGGGKRPKVTVAEEGEEEEGKMDRDMASYKNEPMTKRQVR